MLKWMTLCGIFAISLTGMSKAEARIGNVKSYLLFGDSYFDTGAGNAVAESLDIPLPSPTPPYFDGRHSNGPIWIDDVSRLTRTPYVDFAVAGAETGTGNDFEEPLGGLFQQLTRYEALHTRVPKNQLPIVDGGGNDFLSLIPDFPGITPEQIAASITTAVTNLGTVVGTLQGLGADKVILWNLGNAGKIPLFTDPNFGLTALSPIYTQIAEEFDAGLLTLAQTFNSLNNSKQQLFIFDSFAVFNEVEAQLTAQGVDLTQHTLTVNLITGEITVTGPQPEHIAFYDEVHPTALTWRLFAPYQAAFIDTLVEGPRFIAAEQDFAFETTRAHRNILDNHFRTLRFQRYICPQNTFDDEYGCGCDHYQVYLEGEGKWGTSATRRGALGFKYDTELVTAGIDYYWSPCLTVGASFTAQFGEAHIRHKRGHIDLNDYVPTLYASFYECDYFIDADISYHYHDYNRIKRKIPFLERTATARTDGNTVSAGLQAGYFYECGCLSVIPVVALDYEHLRIEGYKEKHAGFLDLKIHGQHQDSLIGKFGGQFFFKACECGILPFAELFYAREFLREAKTIGPRLYKSHDGAVDYHRTGNPDRDYLTFAVGVYTDVTPCISGNILYEGETTFREYNNVVKAELDYSF